MTPLIAIGEAKWGETMGLGHLERLRRIRAILVAQQRPGAEAAKLVCYSKAGFSAELQRLALQDDSIVLAGIADLYSRS